MIVRTTGQPAGWSAEQREDVTTYQTVSNPLRFNLPVEYGLLTVPEPRHTIEWRAIDQWGTTLGIVTSRRPRP